jgi:hypothetical protein
MYFPKAAGLAVGALLPIFAAVAPASAAVQETFDWTVTGVADSGLAAGLSGSGELIATQSTNGAWVVNAVTGTVDNSSITGLANFLGADNLVFSSTTALVDDHGFSFSLKNGQDVDIFSGGPNGLYEVESTNTFGTAEFTLTAAVPEPSTWATMILGFCSLGIMAYRRKSKQVLMAARSIIRH